MPKKKHTKIYRLFVYIGDIESTFCKCVYKSTEYKRIENFIQSYLNEHPNCCKYYIDTLPLIRDSKED